ncbi:uncharacterized protein BCR38DRAFT_342782 [Pseudomassariella vexata]|uniref:Calcium uniporter protein n=1 Tax=Pseudomassariella vexata TaxID=1141098 RepID=A0A1Y2DYW1_9PEZI|nr:uncharacterized protein BCR38DRAFT_342782 [Pseudomassariella vexata]ORY64498.1 hypothetical protein BCR38DRAFT_342782 [Pseudomassariella vexata]
MSYVFRRGCLQLNTPLSLWQLPAVSRNGVGRLQNIRCSAQVLRRLTTTSPARTLANETARETNQRDQDAHENEVRAGIQAATKSQIKRPWQREGADKPPVDQEARNANKTMAKGKLLTTPTRLLKLILPLPVDATHDEKGNKGEFRSLAQNEDIQPLALLVHPQQPLSYLERLIQAELPPIYDKNGREKMPNVYFRAEGSDRDEDGEVRHKDNSHVATQSGLGREGPATPAKDKDWVRWSSSTEIGDFIRDAARGREFAIDIDGHDTEMRVGVPSFNDRTHFMRVRLRRLSHRIEDLSKIKQECDELAHRGAHRLAKAGFGALTGWWGVVYFVTFHTDAGWDLVEPVTYLAGLTTIMGGYLWFLFISKDLSYRAALNMTITRRQNALYETRGFDPAKWETLVQDANGLRHEIRVIAQEYDVDYDEYKDLGMTDEVQEVLDTEEEKQNRKGDDDGDAEAKDKKKDKEKDTEKTGKQE